MLREVIDEHRGVLRPPLRDVGGETALLRPEDIQVAGAPAQCSATGGVMVGLLVLAAAARGGTYGWMAWTSPFARAAAVTFNKPPDVSADTAEAAAERWPGPQRPL